MKNKIELGIYGALLAGLLFLLGGFVSKINPDSIPVVVSMVMITITVSVFGTIIALVCLWRHSPKDITVVKYGTWISCIFMYICWILKNTHVVANGENFGEYFKLHFVIFTIHATIYCGTLFYILWNKNFVGKE